MLRCLTLFLFLVPCLSAFSQWTSEPFNDRSFVENQGQWDAQYLFKARSGGVDLYFSKQGIVFRHDKEVVLTEEERLALKKNKTEDPEKKKKVRRPFIRFEPQTFSMTWENASPAVLVLPENKKSFVHTFPKVEGKNYSSYRASAFSKLTYKNLYPGIDVEYVFPENKAGFKYNIIVHPGADPQQIGMVYDATCKLSLESNGDLQIQSAFGIFTDHAPISFTSDKTPVQSVFRVNGQIVKFSIGKRDRSKDLIIDPWVTNPAFAGYNAGYDIRYDNAGNVYVFGSYNPLQLVKFNNAGAVQWYYNMLGAYYAYGDFAVDENTGFSYLAEGKTGPTMMHKVDPNGNLVLQNSSGNTEMWRLEFNRVTNEFIIGETGNGAEIMDVNLNLSMVNVTGNVMNDNALMCIDQCTGSNDIYMAGNSGEMVKVPATTLTPTAWNVNNGHTFLYAGCRNVGNWVFPVMGYNGMAVSANFLYTFDGALLKKWDKNTGAFITSINVTNNPFREGGLSTDHCNNVYVGANNAVNVYDPNLNLLTTIALPDTVYDVVLGRNNLLYACGQNFTSEIQLPPSLSTILTMAQTPASCTACNGTASVTVSNSCINTTYLWMPGGQTTASISNLCAGMYTVTVTNACNDQFVDSIQVLGPPTMNLSTSQQNILCFGQGTGSATATPSSNPPYTYSWSNGQTTQTATGLNPGTYTVTVTDGNGCTVTATVTITGPTAAISATLTPTATTCGNANGSIASSVTGGTAGYTYSWNPSGSTAANPSGLASGSYTVTVTDANGCTATFVTTVAASTGLTATASSTNVSCNGGADGSATVTASGTSPFTYSWSPSGGTNANATGLVAGTYTCTITDANGCSVTQTVTITQPPAIGAGASATLTVIPQGGSSQLMATGGVSYSWSPATGLSCTTCQNPVASPQTTTTYCVIVTDASGCTGSACVTVAVDIPCGEEILKTLMPTAFSPNKDGRNDELCVPANLCISSFNLKIYERWGEKVFETEDVATCWDGTFKGKPLNTAAFVYHFVATLNNGDKFEQKGNISLVQ